MTRTGVADGPRVVGDGATRGKENKFFCVWHVCLFILTSLFVGRVIGWGLHLIDCSFPGFGPLLDAPPCFITYPPVPDFHIGGCRREMAVAIPVPSFVLWKFYPSQK